MSFFRFHFLLGILLIGISAACQPPKANSQEETASKPDVPAEIEAAIDTPHPRLFLNEQNLSTLDRSIEGTGLQQIDSTILAKAEDFLETEPVERQLEGKRLLGVSRTALKRVVYLSFAHRRTGEQQYGERAEAEMLAAADFKNWNPDHFLDVGEMTAALAIGYDWLYDTLSAESRRTIRQAIIEKGLTPSFAEDWWWISDENNWNQVCHGGLVLGALAIMDHAPDLATKVVSRAVENVRVPMKHYGPNGGYIEGPGYWSYGSHFNVLMIDALETTLGTAFGLTEVSPFMQSSTFYLHTHTPTLHLFNYSDSGSNSGIAPAMYWFANRQDRPGLLWMEKRKLERTSTGSSAPDGRLLPMTLLWADAEQMGIDSPPEETHYHDTKPLALGLHRSEWNEQATFVGIEGGKASQAHGHMDAGSFVMEADGVRWAVDLGSQDYHSLEEAGLSLWNPNQDGDRWTIYRLNNYSHNTLVVNGKLQRADGFANVVESEDGVRPHTVLDLTEVYAGQLSEARRGVTLLENESVLVQDEIAAPTDTAAKVRWGMVTRAEVEQKDGRSAILRHDGQTLHFEILEPTDAEVEIYSTDPPAEYDAPNPGTRMIGFTTRLDPGAEARLVVTLVPGGAGTSPPEHTPLSEW